MSKLTIRAEKQAAMAFDIDTQGHVIKLDADSGHGGVDYGPTPKALLLTALAGCTGMDVNAMLDKMSMPFDRFSLEISGETRSEHPQTFETIHIRYIFSGSEVDTAKVEKAVGLSLDKYCPVAATLKHTAEITHEVVVE